MIRFKLLEGTTSMKSNQHINHYGIQSEGDVIKNEIHDHHRQAMVALCLMKEIVKDRSVK